MTQQNNSLEAKIDATAKAYDNDKAKYVKDIKIKNKQIADIKQDMDRQVTKLNEENKKCKQQTEQFKEIINDSGIKPEQVYKQIKGTSDTFDTNYRLGLYVNKDEDRKLINIFKYLRLPELKTIWIRHPEADDEDVKQFMKFNRDGILKQNLAMNLYDL